MGQAEKQAGERVAEWQERPCLDCGELTCNDEHCRECNLERAFAHGTCRACLVFIMREEFRGQRLGGPIPDQHEADCPLKLDPDYGPRNEDEIKTVREGRRAL